jgi:AcrR family transcriptional regulator
MSPTEPVARKTRRYGEELEDALLDAAWEVLVERGYAGFSYEAVAERAATSRPVLYRRWPTLEELLLATLRKHWRPIPIPDTGSLRGDAIAFLTDLVAARARLVAVLSIQLASFFAETGRSLSQIRDALRGTTEPGAFRIIIDRAVARGEIPEQERPARLVELPFDLIQHQMLMTGQPVTADAIEETVDALWLPLLQGPS